MPVPVFQNTTSEEMTIPTQNGSGVVLPINKYVRGTYYHIFSPHFLTQAPDPTLVLESDIVYTFPEPISGSYGSISEIVAGPGLVGGGTTGVITLAVSGITADMITDGTITADKIAQGQVVKSLNGLFDTVTLSAGTGIVLTPTLNNLLISTTSNGLTSVNPTAPLTLSLSNSNQTLNGSIAITATNGGGAVALQPTFPGTQQIGNINISGFIFGKIATTAGIFTIGTYQVDNYSHAVFSGNAALGIVTFELPELSVNYPSGVTFTFVKSDATTNNVAVTSSSGQLINGITQQLLTTQWQAIKVSSITSLTENYWVMV